MMSASGKSVASKMDTRTPDLHGVKLGEASARRDHPLYGGIAGIMRPVRNSVKDGFLGVYWHLASNPSLFVLAGIVHHFAIKLLVIARVAVRFR